MYIYDTFEQTESIFYFPNTNHLLWQYLTICFGST